MESITLYFRSGPSDKVYQASIHPKDAGYLVHFAYGRRGTTLSTGSKTQTPVDYPIAKDIYDRLVREKLAKGYTPGTDAGTTTPPDSPGQHSGIQCQLLNSINEQQLDQFLLNPDYWMQEKLDGRRLIIRKDGDQITGINRLGFSTAVPETIARSAAKYPRSFLLDGEAVGDTFHAFDLLTIGPEDMRPLAFSVRYLRLRDMLNAFDHPHIREVRVFFPPQSAGYLHGARQTKAGDTAAKIQKAIAQSLKLYVSVGVGTNKLVSQIASKLRKPHCFIEVAPGFEQGFLWPLENKWLPQVSPQLAARLNTAGLRMAEHAGEVFCATLPSGKIWAARHGRLVSWDHSLPSGWHHIAAVKTAGRLTLHVDGKPVSESSGFDAAAWNLDSAAPLRLGTGMNGPFNGQLADVQIHRRALSASEIEQLASKPPEK